MAQRILCFRDVDAVPFAFFSPKSQPGQVWRVWGLGALVLAVQFGLQAYFFPLKELLTATPLYHIDSPFHQYQMEVARALCEQHRLVGYDPFFAAGYLGGVTFNASAKIPAAAACAIGSLQAVIPIYKAFSFWMGVLAPVAVVLAAGMLQFEGFAAAIAAALAMVIWWTGPLRWYHTAGLVSYVAAAYWVVPFSIAVSRVCKEPNAGRLAALALAAAAGTLLHPLFAVAATLVAGGLLLTDWRNHGGFTRIGFVSLVVLIAVLALNGVWLQASLTSPSFVSIEQPYQHLVDPLLVVREPLGIAATAAGGSRLYLALLIGAVASFLLSRGAIRRSMLGLMLGAVLLMLWASLGGLWRVIGALQPNRFSALAWLVLLLPAAWGASALWEAVQHRPGARALAAAGLCAFTAVALFFVRDALLEVFADRQARYAVSRPEVKGEGPLSAELITWVLKNTDPSARLYLETSLGRIHDGAHMAGIYALRTQREFIGGPYPFTDFANAWDDVAFGRSLRARTAVDLARYLDLYNIRWMLCHSTACRNAMSAVPDTAAVAIIGPLTAYERRMTPSYFIVGTGAVAGRCINNVDIISRAGTELVLKYHWAPGLATVPSTLIETQFLADDPRPFVVIPNSPGKFSLFVGDRPPNGCSQDGTAASSAVVTRGIAIQGGGFPAGQH